MLAVVNNADLSPETKVNQYNQALADVTSKPIKTKPDEKQAQDETRDSIITQTLTGIPKMYKGKADNLIKVLLNSKRFGIQESGEVSIEGDVIPQSNVTDLINKAVNPRFTQQKLTGWTEKIDFFKKANVHKSLLGSHVPSLTDHISPPLSSKSYITVTPVRRKELTASARNSQAERSRRKTKKPAISPAWVPY
jgi:hypothetical protein